MAAERMRRTLSSALLACVACSGRDIRLGDGPLPAQRDGGSAFSTPVPIAALAVDQAHDDDPSLSADLRLLYFNSERSGGRGEEDIWAAERPDVESPWRPPTPVEELNTERRETGVALAPDALTLFFSSDRPGGRAGLDVYVATRAARAEAWSAPRLVEELSSESDDLVSSVSRDLRAIYLARRDDDDDDYDLLVARRASVTAPFDRPEPLVALNTDAEESDAFETAFGAELLFTRDGDLWSATRNAATSFAPPLPLGSLNSEADDRDAWANEAGDYVVFSSDRTGTYLLYEAFRGAGEFVPEP